MELSIVFLGVVLAILLGESLVETIQRQRENKKLVKLIPTLDALLQVTQSIKSDDIADSLASCKAALKDAMVILVEGKRTVNICPRCGDTLTVRDYGRIFVCPNYPECCFLIETKKRKPLQLELLKVK